MVLLFAACHKPASLKPEKSPILKDQKMPALSEEGDPVPEGTPDDTPIAQTTIGSAGGELTSTDGKVKVTIPAGALTTSQHISIQRITNTNPMGANKGYRLLPHGLQFTQPVSVSFSYDEKTMNGTIPEALGIAFQNDEGIWWALPVVTDTAAKKVTVSTTHFSDWSLFKTLELLVYLPKVPVSGSTPMYVFCNEDFFEPIPSTGKAILQKRLAAEPYIVEWLLMGNGDLSPYGAEAVYTAADHVTPPATVSVELNPDNGKRYILMARIEIVQIIMQVRIDGGEWYNYPNVRPASYIDGAWFMQNVSRPGVRDLLYITAKVPRNGGRAPLSDFNSVLFDKLGLKLGIYYKETELGPTLTSPGFIEVSANEEDDQYIFGRFEVEKAGEAYNFTSTHKLEGFFYVMKASQ